MVAKTTGTIAQIKAVALATNYIMPNTQQSKEIVSLKNVLAAVKNYFH